MRFSSLLAIAVTIAPVFTNAIAADAALDAPLLPRSAQANGAVILSGAVNKVKAAVDTAVLKINSSDINPLLDVATISFTLNETIYNQTSIAKKSPKTDEACTDYVQYFVEQLIACVQKLSKDIIAIKEFTVEASVNMVVEVILQCEKRAADMFADMLISKVPASRKKIAKADKKRVDNSLKKAIKVYAS